MDRANVNGMYYRGTVLFHVIVCAALLPSWTGVNGECDGNTKINGLRPIATYEADVPVSLVLTSSDSSIVYDNVIASLVSSEMTPTSSLSSSWTILYSRVSLFSMTLADCKAYCEKTIKCVGFHMTQVSPEACMVYFADEGTMTRVWTPSPSGSYIRPRSMTVTYTFPASSIPPLVKSGCIVVPMNPGITLVSDEPVGIVDMKTYDLPMASFTLTYQASLGRTLVVGLPEIRFQHLGITYTQRLKTGRKIKEFVRVVIFISTLLSIFTYYLYSRYCA